MSEPAYCPYYCEENIWHLAADPRVGAGPRHVVLISNPGGTVALWGQRSGTEDTGGLVVWDYHVILTCAVGPDAMVWDLDTRLGAPVPLAVYLSQTFRGAPEPFHPMFRVTEADAFRSRFRSDRRHMREDDGAFMQPPPSWPAIGPGHTLPSWLDFDSEQPGRLLGLPGLVALLG
ncbi:MAG: hypothetical protein KUG77_18195 [Nannocystaceae bacterium]|nr:hypothetical protein [Nannocystaceae bacterium]